MVITDGKLNGETVDVIVKDSGNFVKNESPIKQVIDNDSSDDNNLNGNATGKMKGFERDKSKRIVCLDCGKCFKHKNSYNCHKRM